MSDKVQRTAYLNVPSEAWMMRVLAESRASMYHMDASALQHWMECAAKDEATTLIVEQRGRDWGARWLKEIPKVSSDHVLQYTGLALSQRSSSAASEIVLYERPHDIHVLPPGFRAEESRLELWAIGECGGHVIVMDGIGRCGIAQGSQLVDFGVDLIDLLEQI